MPLFCFYLFPVDFCFISHVWAVFTCTKRWNKTHRNKIKRCAVTLSWFLLVKRHQSHVACRHCCSEESSETDSGRTVAADALLIRHNSAINRVTIDYCQTRCNSGMGGRRCLSLCRYRILARSCLISWPRIARCSLQTRFAASLRSCHVLPVSQSLVVRATGCCETDAGLGLSTCITHAAADADDERELYTSYELLYAALCDSHCQ